MNNKNNIKKGVVSVNGVSVGDIVSGYEGVVVGFEKVEGEWMALIRECGEEGWSMKVEEIVVES